ncbi:PINIT domain-containing protein [Immersiella caudata]|uniref:PINIT domain-containing protein n=1 Tax=Immersiella caudata TaxID=314043 RepID=A0AA40C327_9PEZI|nr:PINIT domain-containing protein [Immersiella caudata]
MDLRSPPQTEIQTLTHIVDHKLSKPQLQNVCSVNGLAKGGNKPDLQYRIKQLITESVRKQDNRRYQEVRQSIYGQTGTGSYGANMAPPYYGAPPPQPPSIAAPQQRYGISGVPGYGSQPYSTANGQRPAVPPPPIPAATPNRPMTQPRPAAALTPGFEYKPSPFYELKRRLGDVKICEVQAMANHRTSITFTVKAYDIQDCQTDPSLRVMVFCAAGNTGQQDIAFPHQAELKVNGGEIKANLRGLKNKAGSTRPVDITDSLRLRPSTYTNSVDFTYALTSKKYYLCLMVCKTMPVETLMQRIQKKIRKDSVIAELTKKAYDPDIEATSLNLSLKCPLSYMRLSNPCRALSCSHIQCFDATSYLQLQEQGPQWLCPICNKAAPFDQLAIDEYVREIVKETPDSVDQVTIDPYGKWSVPGAAGAKQQAKPNTANFLDDDEIVISSYSKGSSANLATPNRSGAAPGPISVIGTPNTNNSRDSSVVGRSGSKRPAEVIDLTLSDDEDDRPVKRTNYGHNGYHGASY